jgi:peptide/nickel transport system substrate-binding protein
MGARSHVILKRNPNYWRQGVPHVDRVVFRFVRDPSAISAAVETGEADIAQNLSLADLGRLLQKPAQAGRQL